jgi:DnaJ-domain-containing protein 1
MRTPAGGRSTQPAVEHSIDEIHAAVTVLRQELRMALGDAQANLRHELQKTGRRFRRWSVMMPKQVDTMSIRCAASILGVRENATKGEIKSAYRRNAKAYHPDLHQAKDAPRSTRASRLAITTRIGASSGDTPLSLMIADSK